MCTANILVELNLAVWKRIATPPNLIPCQIFWLYGTELENFTLKIAELGQFMNNLPLNFRYRNL